VRAEERYQGGECRVINAPDGVTHYAVIYPAATDHQTTWAVHVGSDGSLIRYVETRRDLQQAGPRGAHMSVQLDYRGKFAIASKTAGTDRSAVIIPLATFESSLEHAVMVSRTSDVLRQCGPIRQ
jgi:hypothetical protein